ncbi:hypothetical protein LTR84_003456 [Exophiala bonariae]|uniref:SnoaL-like domain-containing protein n=1 Tax=Exophiala bonariae TaxID=1690606 RepID=A0AAV9NAQ4_9EURO|nr:hypothetical protein LTR84_003456 [Exophiala bonariae]
MYQAVDLLLDRANIHDTITKLVLYVDMRDWDRLALEVPADHMILDYTLFYGGDPTEVTPKDLVAAWQPLIGGMTATQHVLSYVCRMATRYSDILISLPQPGHAEDVDKASVIANVRVRLVKKGAQGGDVNTSGGRYEIDLIKRASHDGNPWRISRFKAVPIWYDGNIKILTSNPEKIMMPT